MIAVVLENQTCLPQAGNSRRYSLEKKLRKALKENKLAALKQDFLSLRAFPYLFIPRWNTSQHIIFQRALP